MNFYLEMIWERDRLHSANNGYIHSKNNTRNAYTHWENVWATEWTDEQKKN